jgi:hypothetical protein
MLGNSIEYGSKFTLKAMQDIASFARTQNMATQAVAMADENVQNTGTGHAVVNGLHYTSWTQDADLDISADLQLTIWLTATAYTELDCRYVADDNGNKQWYQCIADHTSAPGTMPGQPDSVNATWRTYWTESSNRAVNAYGMVCTNLYSRHVLVLASIDDGTMVCVNADNGLQLDADSEIVIPAFDPEIFLPSGRLDINCTDSWVFGDDDKNGQVTVVQLIGPVFPSGAAIDAN